MDTDNHETEQELDAIATGLGGAARVAARILAKSSSKARNNALLMAADEIENNISSIMLANDKDMEAAAGSGLSDALVDRLGLNPERVTAMADGLRQIASLPDPIGEINNVRSRPSGISVGQMRVPLGVICIIYEARPSVTADAAGLCIKSGNAVILRGGSEAINSNRVIGKCIASGLSGAGITAKAAQLVDITTRALVPHLLRQKGAIDLMVPRGGKGLVSLVAEHAKMPVLKHLDGICHTYIDDDANIDMAVDIAFNAKTQRLGTCNTMESLLIAKSIAKPIIDKLIPKYQEANIELRACAEACKLIPNARLASDTDYATEYLGPILSIKLVLDIDEAMAHIDRFGSNHTDSIVTNHHGRAMRFLREVDSSSVMVNASTRFADGFEYGLGAEMGISTDRFHARGPVGLEGLTVNKYIVLGSGQIRS
ncbi:MAG: glutamate-5-semialdehyde dehydrogenase [Candidatus Porifericomitaceae bacterium WSBS_2022_MAG_OTU9]